MQTLAQIRAMLDERGIAPRKALGQNFLIDQNLIAVLIDAAGVRAGDRVLEVGPGTGTLTEALMARGASVIACELDRGLAQLLADRLVGQPGPGQLTLIRGDCLASKHAINERLARELGDRPFSLVANLPYGAATPLIATLLTDWPACSRLAVTIQREVADRLEAGPGTRAYGPLAALIWATGRIERVATLAPACFWPRPEVTSAMVLIERLDQPRVDDPAGFARFCQTIFQSRRKQLGGVLARLCGPIDWPAGIDSHDRAEALAPDRLAVLWDAAASGYTEGDGRQAGPEAPVEQDAAHRRGHHDR